MKFANGICIFTEDVQKFVEFYQNVLQIKTEINDVHVDIALDGGGITIYSKSRSMHFRDLDGNIVCFVSRS